MAAPEVKNVFIIIIYDIHILNKCFHFQIQAKYVPEMEHAPEMGFVML